MWHPSSQKFHNNYCLVPWVESVSQDRKFAESGVSKDRATRLRWEGISASRWFLCACHWSPKFNSTSKAPQKGMYWLLLHVACSCLVNSHSCWALSHEMCLLLSISSNASNQGADLFVVRLLVVRYLRRASLCMNSPFLYECFNLSEHIALFGICYRIFFELSHSKPSLFSARRIRSKGAGSLAEPCLHIPHRHSTMSILFRSRCDRAGIVNWRRENMNWRQTSV